MQFISDQQVQDLCSMSTAIDLMKEAFSALSCGRAQVPLRTNLAVTSSTCSLVMPVAIDGLATFGLKAVSLAENNRLKQLPRIHGTFLLFDTETGIPVACIEAEAMTALRTGASVGLATHLLSPQDIDQVSLFGTGRQAAACIAAILEVRSVNKVSVYSRDKEKRLKFCHEMESRHGPTFDPVADPAQLKQSNIICLATSSRTPVFDPAHLPDSFHLNAIGSYQQNQFEFDSSILKRANVIVDQKSACLSEAGEIVQAFSSGELKEGALTEIGQIVEKGHFKFDYPRTIFKSVGNAVQDLVVANHVYSKCSASNFPK